MQRQRRARPRRGGESGEDCSARRACPLTYVQRIAAYTRWGLQLQCSQQQWRCRFVLFDLFCSSALEGRGWGLERSHAKRDVSSFSLFFSKRGCVCIGAAVARFTAFHTIPPYAPFGEAHTAPAGRLLGLPHAQRPASPPSLLALAPALAATAALPCCVGCALHSCHCEFWL